jgi:RNase P subunit RPR2
LRGNTLATAHQITGDSLAELGDLPGSVDHYLSCLETASKGPSVTWQAAKRLSYIYEYADRLKEARKLHLLSEQANNALPFRVTHQFPVIDLFNQLARNYDSSLKGRNATPPPKHWPILSVRERDEQSVLHRMVRCPECNVRTKANQTTISTLVGECKSCGIVFSKKI